jgi:hypothetical protein
MTSSNTNNIRIPLAEQVRAQMAVPPPPIPLYIPPPQAFGEGGGGIDNIQLQWGGGGNDAIVDGGGGANGANADGGGGKAVRKWMWEGIFL